MKKEITTKDLMALNELMTFENWLAVKLKNYSLMAVEKSTANLFKTMAQVHYSNHEKLLSYLESNAQEGGK